MEGPIRRDYERPHEDWQCGHGCRDRDCVRGPTLHGRCQAGPECQPVQVLGKWQCTRSTVRGGPCPDGPHADGSCCRSATPCLPRASLRLRRAWFTFACGAFTLGATLIFLGSTWRNEMLAPGGLIGPHAQILSGERYQERCAACHDAGSRAPSDWVLAATVRPPSNTVGQSQKCLVCHDKQINPTWGLTAHTMDPEVRRTLTAAVQQRGTAHDSPWIPNRQADTALACATCHREHHGRHHDLTQVANAQCQTCHAQQFSSFAQGHPEFAPRPADAATRRIVFDHQSHIRKHFIESKQEIQCTACHQGSSPDAMVATAPYAQACGACHDPKIRVALSSGQPIVALPLIDTQALATVGITAERWPTQLDGDFDGKISLSMRLLLASDPRVREALTVLGPDGDFANVDPDDQQQLRQAAIVTDGIVRLLRQLAENVPLTLQQRSPHQPWEPFAKSVPQSWWQDTLQSWFPSGLPSFPALSDEPPNAQVEVLSQVPNDSQGGSPRDLTDEATRPTSANATVQPTGLDRLGVWERATDLYQISYTPSGHGDPWVKAWLDVVAAQMVPDDGRAHGMAGWSTILAQSPEAQACLTCHPRDGQTIRWSSQASPPTGHFTKFRHGPHLVQPLLRDCTACHALGEPKVQRPERPTGVAAMIPAEGQFKPLRKETCVGCHTPQGAGDGCVQCHVYHQSPGNYPAEAATLTRQP